RQRGHDLRAPEDVDLLAVAHADRLARHPVRGARIDDRRGRDHLGGADSTLEYEVLNAERLWVVTTERASTREVRNDAAVRLGEHGPRAYGLPARRHDLLRHA